MLSPSDLSAELEQLAAQARDLARDIKANGDLPARTLAQGLVEAGKLGDRLEKLKKGLHPGKGKRGR